MEAKAVRRLCIIFFKGCSILSPPRPGGTSAPLAPTITPLLGAGGDTQDWWESCFSSEGTQWGSPLGPLCLATSSLATARDGKGWGDASWVTRAIDSLRICPWIPPNSSQSYHSSQSLPCGCLPECSCHGSRHGLTGQGQLLALGTQPWHCQSR